MMKPLIQFKQTPILLTMLAFLYFGLLPKVQAVNPSPPGGYPNFTTAAGDHALQALTIGIGNTAIGTFSLSSVTTGSFNTAVGAGALDLNLGDSNTATGAAALLSNTTGTENTANGTAALEFNTGSVNTANGAFALFHNIGGSFNTATGVQALFSNTIGFNNTTNGFQALFNNATGGFNTAIGDSALFSNTDGSRNIALGNGAGFNVTTANDVICIGANGANISNSCYIGQIFGATSASGTAVLINSDGRLGTTTSSLRFKEDINPMNKASEAVLALRPVTFRYKKEIDPAGRSQVGLVAEEVEKVNPDLIVRDKEGKPYSVRYDQVNVMLLNEFLKAHGKLQEQEATITRLTSTDAKHEATIAKQQKQIEALTAGLQKVSAQLEASRPAPQVVLNNQ
jgi:uncharacterized coiled-coil protein SlyX